MWRGCNAACMQVDPAFAGMTMAKSEAEGGLALPSLPAVLAALSTVGCTL